MALLIALWILSQTVGPAERILSQGKLLQEKV
jgi:hypothetical protein